MKNILHIISSPRGEESISTQLGRAVITELQSVYPDAALVELDLVAQPIPHIDPTQVFALRTPVDELTPEQLDSLKRSDQAIDQLRIADEIVVSLPLHNFGVSSVLKSWLDNVLRPGHTFRYGPDGPKGLLEGKKVYVAIATGGVYSEGPSAEFDFAVPYLRKVFEFIGITDFQVFRAEGIGMPALRETALQKAIDSISLN